MENRNTETTSQNKYTSPIKLIASLVAIVGFIGIAYVYADQNQNQGLTIDQIEQRKTAETLAAQTKIDMDNLKTLSDCHDIAERDAKYPEEYLSLRETCYQKGRKADIVGDKVQKLYSGTSSGAASSSVPWHTGSLTSNVEINEEKNNTLGSEKGESDDSRTQELINNTIQIDISGGEGQSIPPVDIVASQDSPKRAQDDILEVLSLQGCRITQDEDSHYTLKGGHIYGHDIACEVGKSFAVGAPIWKNEYTVVSNGYDKRLGDYIVLENKNYRFVFAHTESSLKVGQKVQKGEQIGYTNASGLATNVHLHFELWRDGYNITHEEMLGEGSRWNEKYSFRLISQRDWYDGIDDAIEFISQFEGFHDTSYPDPLCNYEKNPSCVQRYSIGYGTYASGPDIKISKDEAKKRIREKVIQNMDFIYQNRLAFSWGQRIALSSFFYNLGTGRPEMIQALKSQDKNLETLWKKYISPGSIYQNGLKNRRDAEWSKFISK